MAVRLTNTQRKIRIPASTLKRAAEATLSSLGYEKADLDILVCGDARMRSLNRRWRGVDAATDVLSFPAPEGDAPGAKRGRPGKGRNGPPAVLGDIVISAQRAKAQAVEIGQPLTDELLFLLVHGILHLAGYDHEGKAGEGRRMMRKQRELVGAIRPSKG